MAETEKTAETGKAADASKAAAAAKTVRVIALAQVRTRNEKGERVDRLPGTAESPSKPFRMAADEVERLLKMNPPPIRLAKSESDSE